MKKQFDHLQVLDSSNTCVQCTGINEGRNERNGVKGTAVHAYVCMYVVGKWRGGRGEGREGKGGEKRRWGGRKGEGG